ncbi:MAG: glycogen/starch/alpha-glucan phosphorylase, partial [Collinsella sp.]|nr:glycogen/starch/alpha-glucan phosphorylase [Collinsella sp.]
MPRISLAELAEQSFGTSLEQLDDRRIYKLLVKLVQERSAACPLNNGKKKLYYISAEFLIGKLLINNMIDLGIYDEVKDQLVAAGHDLNKIEEFEVEPSLGNGGLGRLAACFLDSIATLGLTGDGVGLNYHYGLFRQRFADNQQKAVPDEWLGEQDILIDDNRSYTVEFGDFAVTSKLVNIDVPGYGQPTKNRLRLFDLASVDEGLVPGSSIDFDKTEIAKNLTLFLYPDDSDEQGRLLRIYQEYFMVSNAAQLLIDEAVERGSNLHDLADYAVVQINDTHPTMVIPELIRLLTTEHDIEFDEAVTIVRSMVAYTNHTILAEALEKWPLASLQKVSPAIADIIVKLDEIAKAEHGDPRVAIIDEYGTVPLAHMDIHFGFSINGVAALHTKILENTELHPFYEIYPEKFSNKTNGITFRRWIQGANPALASLLDDVIGTDWRSTGDLSKLAEFADDKDVLERLAATK